MKFRFTIVESNLNRAEFRWKWFRFLERTSLLGILVSLGVLLFAFAILRGWITSTSIAITFFVSVAGLGLLAWLVLIILAIASSANRRWLAAALEKVDSRLLDRLNTLLFLEDRRHLPHTDSFALRIAQQTRCILADKPAPSPFRAGRSLALVSALALVIAGTVCYYHYNSPWQKLVSAEREKARRQVQPPKPMDLALPTVNNVEQNQNWGEVRITDPGADLKVTKVDVVPLQIEAAANEPIQKVAWASTVNGGEEVPHELPPPSEPRYAVYQPTLYLDELNLSDWDVMTYYAKANADKAGSFASEIYFLEVRPFREDILKMPGGEHGKAYQCLNQLTKLINSQQHVIRQTHQHIEKPPEQENLKAQDRKKLSEAEGDLRDSAEHLYAEMAATMENKPIGDALDNLAKASESLDQSSGLLRENQMKEAPNRERQALMDLVAARKTFQKAVNEHPDAFNDEKDSENDEQPRVALDDSKKLQQMAEFRNEAKAAQQFVQKSLEQQRSIEQQANSARRPNTAKLGQQERQLQKELSEFQQQHPQAFKRSENETKAAGDALDKAAESFESGSGDAKSASQEASQDLQNLAQALAGHNGTQQLSDAYRLKQMLDQQISTLGDYASNPPAAQDLQNTANAARETVNQLKKAAEQEPTRDAFGQPLRDALSGDNKVDLDTKLNQLQLAQSDGEKRDRSEQARQSLSKVSQAFDASEPGAMRSAKKGDSLKPSQQDGFNLGMAELQSLLTQLEQNRKLSPKDQARQGREALFNLQTGLRSLYGDNERGDQILLRLDQMVKAEALDVGDLKKLMDELQHFSVETSDRLARKDDKPDITNIDPTRLPPAYRGRIQKYFQKLSED